MVVLGGGLIGCETALWLAEQGYRVRIIEMLPALMSAGPLVSKENRQMTIDLLAFQGVEILLNTTIEWIEGSRLSLQGVEAASGLISCDTLVIATGIQPNQQLFAEANASYPNVRRIGDCLRPRNIQGAIWDAHEVARRL